MLPELFASLQADLFGYEEDTRRHDTVLTGVFIECDDLEPVWLVCSDTDDSRGGLEDVAVYHDADLGWESLKACW